MIQYNIPDIIEHLQLTYGFLTDEDLSDREDVLKKLVYDPIKTIDNVFNKIVKHQDLFTIVNNSLTDEQQVSIAYKIFNRARIFLECAHEMEQETRCWKILTKYDCLYEK